MIAWLVLLTPLVLLPIVLLLCFVGCQFVFPVDEDEDQESTGTTTGNQPTFIAVDLKICPMCESAANAIDIVLSTDITTKHFTLMLTSVAGQTISTEDLHITLDDEGTVSCSVDITPAEGEPPPSMTVAHDKVKNELVEPFKLVCQEGFELS